MPPSTIDPPRILTAGSFQSLLPPPTITPATGAAPRTADRAPTGAQVVRAETKTFSEVLRGSGGGGVHFKQGPMEVNAMNAHLAMISGTARLPQETPDLTPSEGASVGVGPGPESSCTVREQFTCPITQVRFSALHMS